MIIDKPDWVSHDGECRWVCCTSVLTWSCCGVRTLLHTMERHS